MTYALALARVGQPARALKYLGDLSSTIPGGLGGDSFAVFKVGETVVQALTLLACKDVCPPHSSR